MRATDELGRRHTGYGVNTVDFDTVGAALIHALQKAAGDAFTLEVEQAWLKLYTLLSTRMMNQFHA